MNIDFFVRDADGKAKFVGSFYNYKYNGKELQETGMYDYGWRQYMPDIGRWYGMDQLSEMYHSLSPYNYEANNPLSFIDPDGWDSMPAWLQSMWDSTPVGTNSHWVNQGSHFVATAFYGSESHNYSGLLGSTVSINDGGFSGPSGVSFNGVGGFSYSYNNSHYDYKPLYTQLPEVILYGAKSTWGKQILDHFNAFMDKWNGDNGSTGWDWDKINTGIGAFLFANGLNTELLDHAVKTGSSLSGVKAELQTLGKTGTRYLHAAKGFGYGTFGVSSVISAGLMIDYYSNGGTDNSVWMSEWVM